MQEQKDTSLIVSQCTPNYVPALVSFFFHSSEGMREVKTMKTGLGSIRKGFTRAEEKANTKP